MIMNPSQACTKFAKRVRYNSAFRRTLIVSYLFYLPVVWGLASAALNLEDIIIAHPTWKSSSVALILRLIWGIAGLYVFSYGCLFPVILLVGTGSQTQEKGVDNLETVSQQNACGAIHSDR